MNLPSPAEIALPSAREAVRKWLNRKILEEFARIGHEHFFDAVSYALLEQLKTEMTVYVAKLAEESGFRGLKVAGVKFEGSELSIAVEYGGENVVNVVFNC